MRIFSRLISALFLVGAAYSFGEVNFRGDSDISTSSYLSDAILVSEGRVEEVEGAKFENGYYTIKYGVSICCALFGEGKKKILVVLYSLIETPVELGAKHLFILRSCQATEKLCQKDELNSDPIYTVVGGLRGVFKYSSRESLQNDASFSVMSCTGDNFLFDDFSYAGKLITKKHVEMKAGEPCLVAVGQYSQLLSVIEYSIKIGDLKKASVKL